MTDPQALVTEFHRTFNHPIGDSPHWTDASTVDFRMRLIEEEWKELQDGVASGDLVNVAKEMADMIYVIYGTAITLGVDLNAVLAEVHRSNMTKLDKDGKPIFRDDGKVLKSDLYELPDIEKILYPDIYS